ncbi:transcriptional regulator [Moorella naiadis]|uniref:helix-turn-helix transcriptional regulator n=1 Tax=Moorella naiadis (nom. illeg.) TaxID=3093670 RepID=UPI003D9CA00C
MSLVLKRNKIGIDGVSRQSLTRIYTIHRWIAAGRYPNVAAIAERLEVSSRTIERDIQILRDSFGAPIVYDNWHRGYRYEKTFSLPPLRLTEGELLTLYLGQRLLSQFGGTPFGQIVQGALTKLKVMLPEKLTVDLALLDEDISFAIETLRGDAEKLAAVYSDLCQAIQTNCSVHIVYYTASRDTVTGRLIDPYHLRFYKGAWYVIAYCHFRREIRLFALDRIQQWQVTGQKFKMAPDFSPEAYLQHSLGIERGPRVYEVIIRFQPEQARWIKERQWHPSQALEELPDGGLVLKMHLSGLHEVKRWLLGFGGRAEVMSPPELRQEMARDARTLAEIYSDEV